MIQAGEYRGKRLRLSAFVRTRDATTPTGAWLGMRVDSLAEGKGSDVALYNTTMDRPITGTTD